jgi:hypothetical protein
MISPFDMMSHFDGTKAGSVVMNIETGSSAPEVMTSDELLNRMRKRNVMASVTTADDVEENPQEDDRIFTLFNFLGILKIH